MSNYNIDLIDLSRRREGQLECNFVSGRPVTSYLTGSDLLPGQPFSSPTKSALTLLRCTCFTKAYYCMGELLGSKFTTVHVSLRSHFE